MRARNLVPEWMDSPDIDPKEHRRALAGLKRINAWSGTVNHLSKSIARIANSQRLKKIRFLDVGCGNGDIAIGVLQQLASRWEVHGVGWDISPEAVRLGKNQIPEATRLHPNSSLRFEQKDVFCDSNWKGGTEFDVVYCSLFLHHFETEKAVPLIQSMSAIAEHAVIVDDLIRSQLGLWLAKLGCRLLSRSPVVHFDGPQSVRAAFTVPEMMAIAKDAQLEGASLRTRWPQRFTFLWERSI